MHYHCLRAWWNPKFGAKTNTFIFRKSTPCICISSYASNEIDGGPIKGKSVPKHLDNVTLTGPKEIILFFHPRQSVNKGRVAPSLNSYLTSLSATLERLYFSQIFNRNNFLFWPQSNLVCLLLVIWSNR